MKIDNTKKTYRIIKIILGFFFGASIFFLITGLLITTFVYIHTNVPKENRIYTKATITEISRTRNIDGDYNYDVFANVLIDGKEVEREIGYYDPTLYEGKEIEVYYDKDNLDYIHLDSEAMVYNIFYVALGGFLIIDILCVVVVFIFINKKEKSDIAKLELEA